MFLGGSGPVVDIAARRGPRWWAKPAAATITVSVIDLTCMVTAGQKNSHGAGPHQGMAAVAVFFFAFLSVFPLFGAWAAAAFPSGKAGRQGQTPLAVFVFLFLTAMFQLFTVWITFSLATNSIGGK